MKVAPEDLAVDLANEVQNACQDRGTEVPNVAVILGSGLDAFVARLVERVEIPFEELGSMPASAVPGHGGKFVVGRLERGGPAILCQVGRVHLYEGWGPLEVTRSVRAMSVLGVKAVLLTNAAGGLVREWRVPCLMLVRDHINLQGVTAIGEARASVGGVYSEAVNDDLVAAAQGEGIDLESGIYAGLLGPSYETPAEIEMLRRARVSAVGMSTVQEAVAAWSVGLEVGAVSCIANAAAGIGRAPVSHDEVVAAGRSMTDDVSRLIGAWLRRLRSP